MKKILSFILTAVILLSALVLPSFATTKADLLKEARTISIYKYIKASVENAARNVEITEAQANALLPLVRRAKALFPEENGPSSYLAHEGVVYTKEQYDGTFEIIDEACKILGWTYVMTPAETSFHPGDIVFNIVDQNGKIIFSYDGDYVTDTGSSEFSDGAMIAFVSCGVVLAALTVVTLAVLKKKAYLA